MPKQVSPGGRPRQSGMVTSDPRTGILTAAADLFTKNGFNATRMAEIAQASGLKQSSIYYWFSSKDAILRAIMDQNRVSLMAARAMAAHSDSAAVRLYIVLYRDVIQMCSAPLNFFDLEEAAGKQPEVFADFREDYEELVALLEKIVDEGISSGLFCPTSATEYVRTALSLTEGSQYRFHVQGRNIEDMASFADSAARLAVRAILTDVSAVDRIRDAARSGIAGFHAQPDDTDLESSPPR